jgi:hypothetical protein
VVNTCFGTPVPALRDLVGALDASPLISYVLNSSYRIVYCNAAWDRFATENGAPELTQGAVLGTDFRRTLGGDLLPFYLQAIDQVAQTGAVWEWVYECSSPELFRKFQMRVQPLQKAGWLVTNARVVERPHIDAVRASLNDYASEYDLITICSNCRRSRRIDRPTEWDFVPTHLDRGLTNISHGLCPLCLEYFYPKEQEP